MKTYFREAYERWGQPLNDFWAWWTRFFAWFGVVAALAVDIIPRFLMDDNVPENYKEIGRIVYSICLAASITGKFTKKDTVTEPKPEQNEEIV